jgi:TusA-related sulfurtransferase
MRPRKPFPVLVPFPISLLIAILLAACDKKNDMPTATATATATTPTASASAKPAASAGLQHMVNCPSAVPGASTTVADGPGGVIVTVTTKDEVAIKDIRERVTRLVSTSRMQTAWQATGGSTQHDGRGHGGGGVGKCPVVMESTTVDAKDVEGGSRITVKADKPDKVAALQKETRDRTAALAKK